MLKRIFTLLLAAMLLLCCLPTAQAGALSPAETYAALQEELRRYLNGEGSMPLSDLTAEFNELGTFRKSAHFGYYTAILRDTAEGDYTHLALYTRLLRLDAAFCEQLPEEGYPTVDELEAYALGCQADDAGDWPAAIAYYEKSIAVLDSLTRVARLWSAGPTATPVPTAAPYRDASRVMAGEYSISTSADGTCTIIGYDGNATLLSIPEQLHGYKVTAIGNYSFPQCSSLHSVVIPNSVTSIGETAFYSCENLTSVFIPDSVTFIGVGAFWLCSNLSGVILPDSVTFIGSDAFRGCKQLTDSVVPSGVTSIEAGTYAWCENLSSITIPVGVTSIGYSAFAACDSLTAVTLPDGLTSLGDSVFWDCNALSSINIPDSVTSIGQYAFYSCSMLSGITLPAGVTSIGPGAFTDCPNLTLRVKRNSFAHEYAIKKGIPYTFY